MQFVNVVVVVRGVGTSILRRNVKERRTMRRTMNPRAADMNFNRSTMHKEYADKSLDGLVVIG